jgi:hypothetical protein
MPTIKVSDLKPEGYNLLSDSESYMKELSEDELGTYGGATPTSPVVSSIVLSAYLTSLIFSAANSNPKSPHKPPQ